MKKSLSFITMIVIMLSFSACGKTTVEWNGKTEEMANLLMVSDITDLYEYVGLVDYVFVGTVDEIEHNVIPEKTKEHYDSYSEYRINVDKNLKGNLVSKITCRKMGGFKKDGTMLLVSAEMPGGKTIMDNGLPEVGRQYIFLAYAQQDGSLTLSEIFDDREYDADLLNEYTEYIDHEIPNDRERFTSTYDSGMN
ncbi:MAG: hypothetical protein K6C36_08760 [Clostridia bacterium]|nr:hypothetical protein [Clostridia bacterium]